MHAFNTFDNINNKPTSKMSFKSHNSPPKININDIENLNQAMMEMEWDILK